MRGESGGAVRGVVWVVRSGKLIRSGWCMDGKKRRGGGVNMWRPVSKVDTPMGELLAPARAASGTGAAGQLGRRAVPERVDDRGEQLDCGLQPALRDVWVPLRPRKGLHGAA